MSQTAVKTDSGRGIPLFPILLVNLIGTLGFALVLPFLVFLVTAWGGNAFIYGLAGATYSAFQLVGAPVLGRWSDAVGRRRILLLSQAGTLVSWLIFIVAFFLPGTPLLTFESSLTGSFALTLPLVVLFLARALDGVTGGNVSVANAYLADISPSEDRAANFGKMAASSNLGFILGPVLAGILGATRWGELAPVVAAAGISLLATLAIVFYLPESSPCILARSPEQANLRKLYGQEHRDCFEMRAAPRLRLGQVIRLTGVPKVLCVYFLVMLGFNFFYVTFPVYAVKVLAWSLPEIGTFFAVMGALMVVVQGPVLHRLSRLSGEKTLMIAGGLLLAAGFAAFDSERVPVIYAALVLLAVGNGVMWPSVLSSLSNAAGDLYQGSVQGVAGSLGAVASVGGLVLGGLLYAGIEARVFSVSAGVILLSVLLAVSTTAKPREA